MYLPGWEHGGAIREMGLDARWDPANGGAGCSMVEIGWNRAIGGGGFPELEARYLRMSSGPDFKS